MLGLDQNKFQDPLLKVPYKMGGTPLLGGSYELAAKLEDQARSLVRGTFRTRSTNTGATITATGTSSVTIAAIDTGKFFVGDTAGNGSFTGIISSIVPNGSNGSLTLSFNPTITPSTGILYLGGNTTNAAADIAGLIHGSGAGAGSGIINGSITLLPY